MSDAVFVLNSVTPIDQQLDFRATVVYIDNFTTLWVYVPGADRYCPPNRPGMGFALNRTTRAQVRFQAPPGQVLDTLGIGKAAYIVFTDQP